MSPTPSDNPMKRIRIAKVTLNVGAGKNEDLLKRGLKLLQRIASATPVKTVTHRRIPGWGLRPGLAIGTKVTIRRNTRELLQRLLAAKDNRLSAQNFDEQGNFSFGIPEYIDIQGLTYDPELKIMGLEVAVTLERPGFRVAKRKCKAVPVGKHHRITRDEAIAYIRTWGVEVAS